MKRTTNGLFIKLKVLFLIGNVSKFSNTKTNPEITPNNKNVKFAPCHKPLMMKTTKILKAHLLFITLFMNLIGSLIVNKWRQKYE